MKSQIGEWSNLDFQSRVDKLVELAYTDQREALSTDEYCQLLGLTEEKLEELNELADVNSHLTEDGKWHKMVGPWSITSLKFYEFEESAFLDYAEEHFSVKRHSEITNGAEPTQEEKQAFLLAEQAELEESQEPDTLSFLTFFKVSATDGRSIRIRRQIGDWGETIDTDGPFLDHEDDLIGYDAILIRSVDMDFDEEAEEE